MRQIGQRGRHTKAMRYGYESEIPYADGTSTRYRTWTNSLYPDTLEEVCAAMDPRPDVYMVGLEVERQGNTYTLAPQYEPTRHARRTGEQIACEALHYTGFGAGVNRDSSRHRLTSGVESDQVMTHSRRCDEP